MIRTLIILSIFLVNNVFAQEPSSPEIGADTEPKDKGIKVIDKGNNLYSIELRNADLKDLIRYFAHEYKLNIIVDKEVTGKVTASLGNITIRQALEQILDSQGYMIEEREGILRVKKKPISSKRFILKNISVTNLQDNISSLLSEEGKAVIDSASNSILVIDDVKNLKMIEEYIKMVDVKNPQVLIEAKFIETTLTTAEKLGINWNVAATFTGAKRPTTFPFRKTGEKSFFPDVDVVTGDFSSKTGFPYATSDDYVLGTLDFQQFQAVLDFLFSQGDTKLISSPRVATLNNQQATISIATEYPLPKFEFNEETGTWNITDYEYREFGISLNVTPTVSKDGYINMIIKPEVSGLTGEAVEVGGISLPITTTKYAETKVSIRDGQTIVIGGLISEENILSKRKLPFFGNIPLIGGLFRHREESKTNKELLIFVTPHIIDLEKELEEKKKKEEIQDLYREGERYLRQDRLEDAKTIYERILALSPDEKLARDMLANIEEKIFKKKKERQVNQLLSKANEYISQGKYEEAFNIVSQALKIDPQHSLAKEYKSKIIKLITLRNKEIERLLRQGRSLYKRDKYFEADEIFLKVLDIQPDNAEALKYHQLCQEKLKELARKQKEREKKFMLIKAQLKKGKALFQEGKYDLALNIYEQILAMEATNKEARAMIIKCKKAKQELKKKNADQFFQEGLRLFNENMLKEAQILFEKALQAYPAHRSARRYLKKVKLLLKKEERKKKLVKKEKVFAEKKPTVEKEKIILQKLDKAKSLFATGNYKEAKVIFAEVLKLNPQHEEARLYYKICEEKLEEEQKEEEKGKELLKRQNEIKRLYKLALKYYRSKKYEKAVRLLERIITLDPERKEVIPLIESCYKKIEQEEKLKIREKIKALLEKGKNFARAEKYDRALECFYQIFIYEPDNKEAMREILYLKKKLRAVKIREAKKLIYDERKRQERRRKEMFNLAQRLYQEKNYTQAKRIIEKLLEQKKDEQYSALLNKIETKLKEKIKKAKPVQEEKFNGKKYYRTALGEYRKGNWAKAREFFQIASKDKKYAKKSIRYLKICEKKEKLEKEKQQLEFYYQKGVRYFELALYEEALKFFKKVMAINPSYQKVQYYMRLAEERKKILEQIGEYEQLPAEGGD